MKRTIALGIAVLVLAVFVISLQSHFAVAQSNGDCVELYINGALVYQSDICTAEPTATASPTFTATATNTPEPEREPTNTPEPAPTDTATPEPIGNGVPDPDDPACPEGSHNNRTWHSLHDAQNDCHFDHAHGQPQPAWVADVFGLAVADRLYTISYPWQTPDENTTKHAGYVTQAHDFRSRDCVGGIDAYAAQFHGVGIGIGKLARFHSFYAAAHLCDGGYIATGGWEDYGQLISPYKKNFVSYPRFPTQEYDIGFPPYVGEGDPNSDSQKETWNGGARRVSRPHVTEHEIAGIVFRIRKAVDFVDPDTRLTGDPVFVPFGGAENNSSAYQLFAMFVTVPDLNGDGSRVDYKGYTDRHGNVVSGCTAPAPDCVPLTIQGALPGSYMINATAAGFIESTHKPGSYYDHDIYFDGQPSGWIDLSTFGQ